jgi:hypothetical protein
MIVSETRVLYGTLSLHGKVLGWKGWCDRCRQHHNHGWNAASTEPQPRTAHCRTGGLGEDYLIAFVDGDYTALFAEWKARNQGRG